MRPAVIATDLDGTVVRSDGTISPRTRAALVRAAEAGALVVVVTGRPPRWLDGIADALGHHGLAICANGALVYDLTTERVIDSRPLDPEQVRRLMVELRAAVPGIGFAVERVDGQFAHEPDYRPRWTPEPETIVGNLDGVLTGPVAKVLARLEGAGSDELLARGRAALGEEVVDMTHSCADGLLEISASGVTKATTLERVLAERHFGPGEVVAFGDMPNDLAMLAWAGHGVAVANAHPALLAVVDEVTASNDEDGVALVLERLFG